MNKNVRQTIKNTLYAFAAQGLSLLLSVLMSLMIPKFLGVDEFGFWQLFLFYSSYVGFFHFGLIDGLYLRLGGLKYEEIDHSLIGTQLKIMGILQVVFGILIFMIGSVVSSDSSRQFVWMSISVFLVLFNMAAYIGYVFQAVNLTRIFSISVMIDKIFFILAVLMMLILKTRHFETFVILYLISKAISLGYCLYKGRKMVLAPLYHVGDALKEAGTNVLVGINLMLANIASMLVLGSGRLVIDRVWGIEAFGKFSFSLSLTNFFLLFISQVSMVLFPALRQADGSQQSKFYLFARNVLSVVLPMAFLAYIPIKVLLSVWLPQYEESLKYLALLLPLCTFDGKMNMLCSTYFKVLRKEKTLLGINVVTMVLSVILSGIGGYIVKDAYFIVVSMVVSIAFRSVISEIYLAGLMNASIVRSLVMEIAVAAIFMYSTWHFSSLSAFMIYLIAYTLFLVINRGKVKMIAKQVKSVVKKGNDLKAKV